MLRYAVLTTVWLLAFPLLCVADTPVVGFAETDAAKYNYEDQHYSPFGTRVLRGENLRWGLGERHVLLPYAGSSARSVWEMLRQFDVFVLSTTTEGAGAMDEEKATRGRGVGAGIERYLEAGGSLLIIAQATRYPGTEDQEYWNVVFEDLGLELLNESVFDETTVFSDRLAPTYQPEEFFSTENAAPGHPVTEGVERLCLPRFNNGKEGGVVGLRLSPEWTVLVRGNDTAKSHPITADRVTEFSQVGTYDSAPPIVAVREFGRGRIMVYAVPNRNVYLNYGVPGWKMVVEELGNQEAGLPSHSNRMVVNALHWLAQTAAGSPELGTFDPATDGPVVFPASVEWDSRDFIYPPREGVRGLIGVKTRLSEGRGTVAEYAQAAREAGLSFIVFNESLEHLTASEFEQLKAECRAVSDDRFYACPGVEFTDNLGNRWAMWAERLQYPLADFQRPYQDDRTRRLPLWDGQVMLNPGYYFGQNERPPTMLLTYRNLREQGAHPVNMWWFFEVPPFVYDRGELVEDNFEEWLYALRDIRHVDPASYTRVYTPEEVAQAAELLVTVGRDLPSVRNWLNMANGHYGHPMRPYVTQGPRIEQWEAVNSQYELPLEVRGTQRARLRFEVSSPAGIAEVRVHDANYQVLCRFLGHGQPRLAQEFDLVHDRDHYLTLEVVDTNGQRAVSHHWYLWAYKTSLFRCADNLNFLNGVGLVWHPWNQLPPLAQYYQGLGPELIRGYDTAAPASAAAETIAWQSVRVNTEELGDYPNVPNAMLRQMLDVELPGADVKILTNTSDYLVEGHDTDTRAVPWSAGVPRIVGENEFFTRIERSYYLQNRANMFITWNYRRAKEGAQNYRGGMAWHEGRFEFKRAATLAGSIPMPFFVLRSQGLLDDAAHTLLVTDRDRGQRVLRAQVGERVLTDGVIAPGGHLALIPHDKYMVFYAAGETPLRYVAVSSAETGRFDYVVVGLGQAGETVYAGQSLPYHFGMATLGGTRLSTEETLAQLVDIGRSFGVGTEEMGVEVDMVKGVLQGQEMFLQVAAADHEAVFSVAPRETIIDLPLRVEGVVDNGCVAVWGSHRPWLRWVGVLDGAAWLQENVDAGSEIWVGNLFLASDPHLRLTAVVDGIAEGRQPWLEVHNPTDAPVQATVRSPEQAPLFGGTRLEVTVPAGATVQVPLERRG